MTITGSACTPTGKSANTQAVYTLALTYLDAFLAEQGMPRTLSAIRREHIEAWLASVRDAGRAPATVSVYYRSLQPFWRWAVEEGFVRESPMGNMRPPIVPEQPVPVLSLEQLRTLLRVCDGSRFEDQRDTAIIRLLVDTGYDGCWGLESVPKKGNEHEGARKTDEQIQRYAR